MESMRDIKIRLNSIASTKQITESMRLVSTRKLQKARGRLADNTPYLTQSAEIISKIANNPMVERHVYVTGRKSEKPLIIMVTGDRGLCGGYNSNAAREAFALAEKLGNAQIIAIGAKGSDYFRRMRKPVLQSFAGLSENPFFEDAQSIGEYALRMYDEDTADQIFLVYTENQSILHQNPKTIRLLPLVTDNSLRAGKIDSVVRYEPGEETFLKYATQTYICSAIFGALLESSVSEQSARVTGMDSAVKNSNKIIDSLTLEYNQIRQGTITQEVSEIVGGANAVRQVK